MEVALLALAVAGLALSIFTTRAMARCGTDSCDVVMTTRYARLFGFPNSIIAAVWFAALGAFAGARLGGVAVPLWPVLAASGASLAMSAYLAFALFVKLKQF